MRGAPEGGFFSPRALTIKQKLEAKKKLYKMQAYFAEHKISQFDLQIRLNDEGEPFIVDTEFLEVNSMPEMVEATQMLFDNIIKKFNLSP